MVGGDPVLANGSTGGLWLFSATYYLCDLLTLLYKAAILTNAWNIFTGLVLGFGLFSWFGYVLVVHWLTLGHPGATLFGLAQPLLSHAPFWATCAIAPLIVSSRDFIWKFARRSYAPEEYHIVQELDQQARQARSAGALITLPEAGESRSSFGVFVREQRRKSEGGYAFAQTAGQARLM